MELRITRYDGGGKGPLLACHGLGTSSILFTLDTIPTNFLEFFLEREYDVWLFETRLSTACPWVSSLHGFTIDDIIVYDIPAAVDKVLEITGEVAFISFPSVALPLLGPLQNCLIQFRHYLHSFNQFNETCRFYSFLCGCFPLNYI